MHCFGALLSHSVLGVQVKACSAGMAVNVKNCHSKWLQFCSSTDMFVYAFSWTRNSQGTCTTISCGANFMLIRPQENVSLNCQLVHVDTGMPHTEAPKPLFSI